MRCLLHDFYLAKNDRGNRIYLSIILRLCCHIKPAPTLLMPHQGVFPEEDEHALQNLSTRKY